MCDNIPVSGLQSHHPPVLGADDVGVALGGCPGMVIALAVSARKCNYIYFRYGYNRYIYIIYINYTGCCINGEMR